MPRARLCLLLARSGAVAGVCLLSAAVAGQSGLRAQTVAPDLAIRSWDARDGLPPGLINDLQRTADGYLWVATRVGLARFDGARFKLFDNRNTAGLRTNWVACLLAEPGGGLWAGTPDGLFRFPAGAGAAKAATKAGEGGATIADCGLRIAEGGRVVEVGTGLGIGALALGGPGEVWALTGSGELLRVAGGKVAGRFKGPRGQPIRAISADASGRVAAVCGNALYTMSADGTPRRLGGLGARARIDAVCAGRGGGWAGGDKGGDEGGGGGDKGGGKGREGGWWVASGREVGFLSETGGSAAPEAGARFTVPATAPVTALVEDREGRLWVGTRNGGIYALDPSGKAGDWRQLTARRPRSFGAIVCLYQDLEGLVWAGTSAGTLRRMTPRRVTAWSLPTTAQEHIPQTVCVAHDGAVWIGTDGAGVYRCQDGVFTRIGAEQGLGSATVMAILEDRQTNLWFGTHRGLFRLREGTMRPELETAFTGQAVPALFQDRAGDLWIGLVGALARRNEDAVKTYPLGAGFEDIEVRAFAEDGRGVIWIGTYGGGLFRLEAERLERDERFPRPALTALHYDREDSLWVGTLNNGLFRVQDGKIGHWRTREGLPSNTLYAILEDQTGRLWLGSNEGVFGLHKEALPADSGEQTRPVAAIHLATSESEHWGAGSGQPAAAQGPDGRLWFPAGQGVVSFDPAAVARPRPALPVLIEEVWVDGVERPLSGVNSLRVLSGARRLEFHYTLADLDAPGRLKFRYKLEGVDDQWVDAGTERVASYGHLPPGRYRFRVIASGSQDLWSELAAPLALEVVPRLWERRWFQLLGAAAILSLVAAAARGVERAKTRRKMERLELQQTMEKERLRIARDLHDDLGAGLTEIMLLGEVANREGASAAEAQNQITTITDKARSLAAAMDEVVWTVNPKNDLVPNLASYLCDYARDFFRAASARCRIDMADGLPAAPLTAQMRHNLFLAVKEALNNTAKHSGATEVWLRIRAEANELRVTVEDNGRGLDPSARAAPGNGLDNMRARLEAVGGGIEIASQPGQGTTVRFHLPLAPSQ